MDSMSAVDVCSDAEETAHQILRDLGFPFNQPSFQHEYEEGYSPYYISCSYYSAENVKEVRITGILYGVGLLQIVKLTSYIHAEWPDCGFKVKNMGVNCILVRFERDGKDSPWRRVI